MAEFNWLIHGYIKQYHSGLFNQNFKFLVFHQPQGAVDNTTPKCECLKLINAAVTACRYSGDALHKILDCAAGICGVRH